MKRIHLFEFTDLPWYPQIFRSIQTDYLQFVASLGPGYGRLMPLFLKAMQHADTKELVDLCSGGTGPWVVLLRHFKQAGWPVRVTLTDKFPHPGTVQNWRVFTQLEIRYLSEPVDALKVPPHLKGMRTLFEGFHHFKPEQARSILQDVVENRTAVGIVEISLNPPSGIPPFIARIVGLFLLILMSPVTLISYILITPFIKPRTLSRFFWTYLIPIVPLLTCWDGIISLLRVYSLQELQELTDSLLCKDYAWEIGQIPAGAPLFVFTYLVGYPL
jgi:hypothetical protein